MPFIIRCNGGPAPGTRSCERLEDYGLSWPLPDTLDVPAGGGVYRKVSESQLPSEAAEHPNVGVGAEYEWDAESSG
jgi:hypothetical protein